MTIGATFSANIWMCRWTDEAKSRKAPNNQIRNMVIYSILGATQGNQKEMFMRFSLEDIVENYFRYSRVFYADDSKVCCLYCWPKTSLDHSRWNTPCSNVFLRHNTSWPYHQSIR